MCYARVSLLCRGNEYVFVRVIADDRLIVARVGKNDSFAHESLSIVSSRPGGEPEGLRDQFSTVSRSS